ncbi:hypothetical protein BE20_28365 [Sorangium cellulosum]|nr:hypothetical protein BE20_28365 [Sorangium cellulosum]
MTVACRCSFRIARSAAPLERRDRLHGALAVAQDDARRRSRRCGRRRSSPPLKAMRSPSLKATRSPPLKAMPPRQLEEDAAAIVRRSLEG